MCQPGGAGICSTTTYSTSTKLMIRIMYCHHAKDLDRDMSSNGKRSLVKGVRPSVPH